MRLAIYIANWVFLWNGSVLLCISGILFPADLVEEKKPRHAPEVFHRMAVLVAARDEENVIAQLLKSIRMQDYPVELIDIYVVADNCEDATADIAGKNGAIVFEDITSFRLGKVTHYAFW